jgi:hypothetical protein
MMSKPKKSEEEEDKLLYSRVSKLQLCKNI